MKNQTLLRKAFLAALAVALAGFVLPARAQDVGYDGNFTLSPVGDLDMVLKMTLPMERYQGLRDSVSNLYLFMRDLASNRADAEVTRKKAEWDDASRTVTFTIHMLGAARNMGNHWEFDVGPGAVYSNLDEDKKTIYFNETVGDGSVRGNSRLVLPAAARQARYDAARKMVTYALPEPPGRPASKALLIPAIALIVLGLGAFGASFAGGRKAPARPAGMPPP
ncbi:MAG: hypothetical protein ABFD52_11930 [Acidobacteriota bacterium]